MTISAPAKRGGKEMSADSPESAWRKIFAIDSRSLAVFRFGMGVLLLADLAIRASDIGAMYTDAGMFSRAEICRRVSSYWNWSFHFASGATGYQIFLFTVAGVLALSLTAGFQTRIATIGSWLMLLSVQHRVTPILSGADILCRMLLFWGMFLPLERKWSVDAWLAGKRSPNPTHAANNPILSVASAAILLQMALMYFFSAIFKSNGGWLRGEIVAGALAHNFYAKPLAAFLLRFPPLLALLTWATFALEWIGPLLLFFPKRTPWVRGLTAAALATMHLGIALTLQVDLFSPVALTGLALFIPSQAWDYFRPFRFLSTAVAPAPPLRWSRPMYVAQGICLLLFLIVFGININSLPSHPLTTEPPVKPSFLRTAFGLGQTWNMFDEVPSKNGWYVAHAELKDGSQIDLLRDGAPLDWQKPAQPTEIYPNFRWRKLFREMAYTDEQGYQLFRLPVARFLCRRWNANHDAAKQITHFEFVFCTAAPSPGQVVTSTTPDHEVLLRMNLTDPEFSLASASAP